MIKIWFIRESFSLYKEECLKRILLELIACGKTETTVDNIWGKYVEYVSKRNDILRLHSDIRDVINSTSYISMIGYLELDEKILKVTPDGVSAIRRGEFVKSTSSCFYNLSVVLISFASLFVSLAALIIAIISMFK